MCFAQVLPAQQRSPDCVTPPPDMVSWYDGDNSATDLQSGYHGTVSSGLAYGPGVVGSAFKFNGVDGYFFVNGINDHNILGDVTLDMWVKRTGFGGNQTFITKGAGYIPQDVPSAYLLRFENDHLQAVFEPVNTGNNIVLQGPVITDTNWHFIAYVRENSFHSLLVDTTIVATGSFNVPPASAANLPLTIGGQLHDPFITGNLYSNFFNGFLDEIEIFNRALKITELRSIYDAGANGKCKTSRRSMKSHLPKVLIYPNPSEGNIFVQNLHVMPVLIEVYSAQGELKIKTSFQPGTFQLTLPIEPGIYHIISTAGNIREKHTLLRQ